MVHLPLSPLITTHTSDPIHLSTSSNGITGTTAGALMSVAAEGMDDASTSAMIICFDFSPRDVTRLDLFSSLQL